MALEFFDGLSPYGSFDDMIGRWAIPSTTDRTLVTEALFPTGRAIQTVLGVSAVDAFRIPVANPSPVMIAGCFFRATGAAGSRILRILSFYNASGELLGGLRASSVDGVYVTNSNGTNIGTVGSISTTEQHYEIKMLFSSDSGVGTAEVRVNEEVVFTFLGVTSTRADQNCSEVRTTHHGGGAIQSTWTARVGHYHVQTPDASPTGTFLGIVQIGYLVPEATLEAGWTPDSGVNHERVDEAQSDSDTSYVGAVPNNARDLYGIEALDAIDPFIYAINVHSIQRLVSPGSRALRHVIGQEGEYDYEYGGLDLVAGEDYNIVTTGYTSRATLFLENPVSEADWTHEDINNLIAGMELNP